MILSFIRISRQDALIETLDRGERRPVPSMMSRNSSRSTYLPSTTRHSVSGIESTRSDRPPQPAPEDRRDHDRQGRQPGAVTIKDRFDALAYPKLDHDVEDRCPDRHRPSRIDGCRERDGQARGYERADVRHEAQQPGKDGP